LNLKPNEKSISIGIPVFNGVRFLEDRLNSILNQSFSDFELIISDNASTDRTQAICEEFSQKDKRIRYIRQEKNLGVIRNMQAVLDEAKNNYFVMAAVDDQWTPDFLEKNIHVLSKNKNFVCSVSKTEFYSDSNHQMSNTIDDSFRKFITKLKGSLRNTENITLKGTYEEKVRLFLKKLKMTPFYGVFRTDVLRKSFVSDNLFGIDQATLLNVLKLGDMFVIDEILMRSYDAGISKKGIISSVRQQSGEGIRLLFPMYHLTKWCFNNLGSKIFFKKFRLFYSVEFMGRIYAFNGSFKNLSS